MEATSGAYARAQAYHEDKASFNARVAVSAIVVRSSRDDAYAKLQEFNYASGVRKVKAMPKHRRSGGVVRIVYGTAKIVARGTDTESLPF